MTPQSERIARNRCMELNWIVTNMPKLQSHVTDIRHKKYTGCDLIALNSELLNNPYSQTFELHN